MKHFNIAGPCIPEDHYMLSTTNRLPELRRLIDQKAYFVVHAPRQVGKTTTMLQLARELTAEGRYAAIMKFYAQADKQVNQKTAPITPYGWGETMLAALSDCLGMIRRYPYEAEE